MEHCTHRRKRGHERRRAALFEIWRDAQLCRRAGSCPGQRRNSAHRRTRAQKQNRFRLVRHFCRLGRNARRRHGNHGEVAAVAAGARDAFGVVRFDVGSGGLRAGNFRCRISCRHRSRSRIISLWKRRDAIPARRTFRRAMRILLVDLDGHQETSRRDGKTAALVRQRKPDCAGNRDRRKRNARRSGLCDASSAIPCARLV